MKTVTEYFNSFEPELRRELKALHKLMRKHAPDYKPGLFSTGKQYIVGYGRHAYKTKSGLEGEWFKLGLAGRKHGISLYSCATIDGEYVAEAFKKKLPKASIGKSCVRFKRLADVDEKILVQLIKKTLKAKPLGY